MTKPTRIRLPDRLNGLLVVLALLLIWQAISQFGLVDPIFLPAPSSILLQLFKLLLSLPIYIDLGTTLYRFFVGFVLGCAIAIPIGIFMGISKRVYVALEPTVELLRPIPASALIPVALLLLGLGDDMTIAIVAYAVIWPVLINTIDGVRSVDPILLDTGRIFGLDSKGLIRKVIIPASLPNIATGMRISLAISIVLVIVVEMLVGDRGLGHRVIDTERTFRFAEMYGTVFLIGLVGYFVNTLFLALSNAVIGWHIKSKEGGQ